MNANSQSRKWLLTINNYLALGLTREVIIELCMLFAPYYFCFSFEIAPSTGTPHAHIYIYSKSPIRFNTIRGRFPTCHCDKAYGSSKENRAYIKKEGEKWANSEKSSSTVEGSFFEWGELPKENEDNETLYSAIIDEIREGKTTSDIILSNPKLALRVKEIEALRQVVLADKWGYQLRDVKCIYCYGSDCITESIYSENDPRSIYRVTKYRKDGNVYFDGYRNENILVFDSFYSQIPIEEMLTLLDKFPIYLSSRYYDRIAMYTIVIIVSSIPPEEQYSNATIRKDLHESFMNKINIIRKYNNDKSYISFSQQGEVINE